MDILDRLHDILNPKRETFKDGENVIEVSSAGEDKTLKFNGTVYSRFKGNAIYMNQYWDFFLPLAKLYDNPKILMIGLGGGTIPFQLNKVLNGRFSLDAVEISPKMAQIAKEFIPEKTNCQVIVGDGADYVKGPKGMYDMIILDAFIDANIPSQFLNADFVENASECLKENGILAINYLPPAGSGQKLDDYAWLLSGKFKVYKVNISAIALNIVLVCSKKMNREEILSSMKARFPVTKDSFHMMREYDQMKQIPPE